MKSIVKIFFLIFGIPAIILSLVAIFSILDLLKNSDIYINKYEYRKQILKIDSVYYNFPRCSASVMLEIRSFRICNATR
jgi:hypothetical protein